METTNLWKVNDLYVTAESMEDAIAKYRDYYPPTPAVTVSEVTYIGRVLI